MSTTCAWCRKVLTEPAHGQSAVSHVMCTDCSAVLQTALQQKGLVVAGADRTPSRSLQAPN